MSRLDLEVQLLPVTKVQFERFLAEPNRFDDPWYEDVLAVGPRTSYRRFGDSDREGVFLTGILPQEALAFAEWMGSGFDLPTVREWRDIYVALGRLSSFTSPLTESHQTGMGCQAEAIWRRLMAQTDGRSLLELSRMVGGLIEWARNGNRWVGLGAPRQEFYPNLYNPLADEVRAIRPDRRLPYFGFRLVRRPP
ncbi:hypothetical protein ACFL5Q_03170 [Planctomycetota bacterium]